MDAINAADPHFVRAVNPNAQVYKYSVPGLQTEASCSHCAHTLCPFSNAMLLFLQRKADLFEDFKAIEQLRCGGVIEAVRMCRESYPSRYPHEEFITTFSSICPEVCFLFCLSLRTQHQIGKTCALQVNIKYSNKDEAKKICLSMVQSLKVQEKQYRLGSSLILLKREVVDDMEKKRGLLLVRYAVVLQKLVREYMSKSILEKKRNVRRNLQSVLNLQSILRRTVAQSKYANMIGVVIQVKKRMSIQVGESNKAQVDSPEVMPQISESSEVPQVRIFPNHSDSFAICAYSLLTLCTTTPYVQHHLMMFVGCRKRLVQRMRNQKTRAMHSQ